MQSRHSPTKTMCTYKLQVTDGMVYPMHNKHKKSVLIIEMFGMVNKHRGKTHPKTYSGGCALIAVFH
jgi:hypothetical protein